MKKRILSVALSAAMVLSSFATAFAAVDIGGEANTVYEGNKPFILAEKILDELNVEASNESAVFAQDKTNHDKQLAAIKAVNESLAAITYTDAELIESLKDSIDLLTGNLTDYQKSYLAALVKAYDGAGDATLKEGLEKHDTTGETLKDSFALLDDYVAEMSTFLSTNGIDGEDYEAVAEDAKKYVAEPLLAILKVMFAQDGTAVNSGDYAKDGKYMRENYVEEFIKNDRAKKTLAVLFGAELTREIVSDSADGEEVRGIVRHVKKYISENETTAISDIKSLMVNVMAEGKSDAVNAAFDALGKVVSDAYNAEELHGKVTMLMGDGQNEGLVELMVKAVDNNTLDASNIWLNLFLSEFVQIGNTTVRFNTIDENAVNPEIEDNDYIYFRAEGLDDYGIGDGQAALSLNTGWFDVAFYAEDTLDSNTYKKTGNVYYEADDGQIQITEDAAQPEKYNAYMVLYRKTASDDETTFIESYPVTIVNEAISTPSRGGGGGTSRYLMKYETNGGTALASEYFAKGSTVELTKVPARDGYKFAGWYLDAALTQKADSVVMNSALTVYAAWTPDEVGEIPEMLNGDDHFAYVQGYPEGDVRPLANITRAETVTILFRLLKDSVREANITTENIFTDVTEDDWYNTAVSTLAALEIINGRTETEFVPNEYITRAEFATIFARFVDSGYVVEDEFTDVQNHWAEEYIHEAASYGWIKGYEDGSYKPENNITRAEAMTVINRVLHRIPETAGDLLEGMTEWSDNSENAWYYLAVQEATNSHEYTRKNDINETWTKLTEGKDWSQYE